MSFDYGYGKLENELIDLFSAATPDFIAAEKLIRQGANVNAVGEDSNENVLSEVMFCFRQFFYNDEPSDISVIKKYTHGAYMCQIIRFFLLHGFDVNKFDGCYGAQCLSALTFCARDRYIIDATKILLDAGAQNRTTSYEKDPYDMTPWESISAEGSYLDSCEHNHALANIYEAVYQIYLATDEDRSYNGIDSYEAAVGKTILKVLATKNYDKPTFYPIDLPDFKKENCYNETLYFVYEDGVLITTQYADFWVNTELPDAELVDVSDYFSGVVFGTIKQFVFNTRTVVHETTHYTQPITTIEMASGDSITFSINFGDVENEDRAAFFKINNIRI